MTYSISAGPLEMTSVENALLIPFGSGKLASGPGRAVARGAGVFDAENRYVPLSQCWRSHYLPTTIPPDSLPPLEDLPTLKGTWLYGGMLYHHFGHFLAESTGRLWGADHYEGKLDGAIFLPKKSRNRPKLFVREVQPWLDLFGSTFGTVQAPTKPLRIERLVIPAQGFGTGALMAGSPEYKAFIEKNFGRDIPAEGAEKVYISRTELFVRRGRYLAEARIEARLKAEGYRIFHPQEHPLEAQIAQYKAAKVILSSDNSALHLAAFFTRPGDRIGIILRRPGRIIEDFRLQFRAFSGSEPDIIDVQTGRYHHLAGVKLSSATELYSELDLPRLGATLKAGGYIASDEGWDPPEPEEIEAEVRRISARLKTELVQSVLPGAAGGR